MAASPNGELPDKDYLYGKFQKTADWRDKLYKKLAHKSLDIGEDDDIHVDKSNTTLGITWKELAVLGMLGLGGLYVFDKWNQQQPTTQQPAATSPADSEYEVRFFDADGNSIKIEPLPQR